MGRSATYKSYDEDHRLSLDDVDERGQDGDAGGWGTGEDTGGGREGSGGGRR